MTLKEIFKLVLGWRLIILILAIPAMFLLTARPGFTVLSEKPSLENIFTMWSNFDGTRYLAIAEHGYNLRQESVDDYAIFPVYPWFIKSFNLFGNYLASGLFLSHLFLILALYILYRLVLLDFKPKIARSAIYLLLMFPTAFFFGSVYSESLFLLLVVLSFYFARKDQFFLACMIAAIASATRVTGVFLWPALIYEYWLRNGEDLKRSFSPSAIWLVLPPLGLLSFMRFQFIRTGNAWLFATIQMSLQNEPVDKLILIHQVFYRYGRMLIFTDHLDPLFFTVVLELLSASLVLLVLILSVKKIRFSYWLFAALSYLLPTFTGTFSGMPRFTLVLFPVFMYLAVLFEKSHPYLKYFYYATCFFLTVMAVMFFTRGYFVS